MRMKRLALAGILGLLGCASASHPIEIVVVNHSNQPVVGTLEAGILNRQVVLWPHQSQVFTIPREYLPDKVRFVLTEKEILK